MSRHQLMAARGAAKYRQAHFGDNGGNAGREGCAQMLTDMLRIRDIDLGWQRHDHRAGQAFLVTHRRLILGPGRLAFAGR
jgi:hypothetical protein